MNLVGLQPTGLGRRLDRPGFGLLPVDLAGGLGLDAIHGRRGEQLGVDGGVLGSAEGEGLDLAGRLVEAHVGGRVVHAVRVGGGVLVVGPDLLGAVGQARLGVDEERQVRPVLAELLVVGLGVDDVADPAQQQRGVGARADGQPHVGLGRLGRHVGVDDDGLDAEVGAGVDQAVAAVGRLGGVRLASPEHEDALGVVDAGAFELGHVHDAKPAVDVVHVDAAVEAHAGRGHEVARHGALARAARQRVASPERRVDGAGLPLDVGSAAAAGVPVGVGAVLLDGGGDLRAGEVDGLFPADRLPLVLAALPHALHGVQHVARAVERLDLRQALEADAALVEGAVGVALDLHDDAVFGVHDDRAGVGAAVAGGLVAHPLDGLVGEGGRRLVEQRRRRGGKRRADGGRCLEKAAPGDVGAGHNLPFLSRASMGSVRSRRGRAARRRGGQAARGRSVPRR